MDTEVLAQELAEFSILLSKIEREIDRLPVCRETEFDAALKSTTKEIRYQLSQAFNNNKYIHKPNGDLQGENPLLSLIKDEKRLVDDSRQMLILLEKILQHNPGGIAIVSGPQLIFRMASLAYQSIVPDPKQDIVGKPYSAIWPLESVQGKNLVIQQMLESEKNLQFERIEQIYPDGTRHHLSLRISRINWYGELGALLILNETTQADRAQELALEIAEEANRQAEELDAIIRAMAESITIFDPNGCAILANPSAIELYGVDPVGLDQAELAQVIGMRHPDGSPFTVTELPSARARRGETLIGQYMLLTDSFGQERVVRASASPVFNETGISGVVTVLHDVTEREHLLEQLEIEQSRLKTIIENAPEAILVADEEGRLVSGNPAAERLLDHPLPYHENYASYARLQVCYMDGTLYEPRNFPLVCSALDGERFEDVEMTIALPNGEIRYLLTSTAPIIDRKGNLNGAVGVMQDITLRKQTEENLRRQADRLQLLANLSQVFAETGLNFSELIDTVVQEVGQVFGNLCSLTFFSEDARERYPVAIYADEPIYQKRLQETIRDLRFSVVQDLGGNTPQAGHAVRLITCTLEQLEGLIPEPLSRIVSEFVPDQANVLVVPLRAHGRRVGVLAVFRLQRNNPFSVEDQAFLHDLAERAALAIEDARLYEKEAQRARELQALHRATTALLSTLNLETLLGQIIDAARSAIPVAEQGMLFLNASGTGKLELRAILGQQDSQALQERIWPYASRVVQEQQPLLINNLAGLGDSSSTLPGSVIIVPLILTNYALGALVLCGSQPNLFCLSDLYLLDSFAATATAAIHNATLYAEVERLATTDTLTGLTNRRKFFELGELEMHRFRRFHKPLSAMMLDLDNFKEINDTYGHASGDLTLRTVAQRVQTSVRVVDILGRYGGDEFAVLLPDADLGEAHEIAERIRAAVTATPIMVGQDAITVSVSIGLAQAYDRQDNLSGLLGRADAALYNAKERGRNRIEGG